MKSVEKHFYNSYLSANPANYRIGPHYQTLKINIYSLSLSLFETGGKINSETNKQMTRNHDLYR